MSEAETDHTLADALARETLAMGNSRAWAAMQARLNAAGVQHAGAVRNVAWRIRRELRAELPRDD